MTLPLWLYDAAAQASLVDHDETDIALVLYRHVVEETRELDLLDTQHRLVAW